MINDDETHGWTFDANAGEVITVSVAAQPNIDIILSISDQENNILVEQNHSPKGLVEILANFPLTESGNFQVLLRTNSEESGGYVLIFQYSDSYAYAAKQILNYGETQLGSLANESDHFWFFDGNSGDSITIVITPSDNSDLFLELYGIQSTNISGFTDEGSGGEPEQIVDLALPHDGLYAIRVGEYEFKSSNYEITLTNN